MNITLIGMAGSGKSVVGSALAKKMRYRFIDIDRVIQEKEKMPLYKIIDICGEKAFLKMEERIVLALDCLDRCVVSPGGSIVYSPKAMEFLRAISRIVFLDCSFSIITRSIGNPSRRGVVGTKEKKLRDIFLERLPLYRKYAHIIIKIDSRRTIASIVRSIISQIDS